MFDAQSLAVDTRTGNLASVVVRPVVERHGKGYDVAIVVEECHGVHASGKYYQRIFHTKIR